ncbi:hypothetical protein OUZ56_006884 [Daphnia magna]|uniref:Uncharacterized protein n=1 Tax=Daphnia magna TaxID=35525 RepID=A0ABQ9YXJ6_9CRUS|nr:hypothetical protein OUZ56_006884 [Daphnia magna]
MPVGSDAEVFMFSSTMFCCPSTNIIPFSQYSRLVNLANNQPSVLNASTPNTFTTQTTSVDFNIQSRAANCSSSFRTKNRRSNTNHPVMRRYRIYLVTSSLTDTWQRGRFLD